MKEKTTHPPFALPSREGLSLIHVVAEGLFNKETLNDSYSERQTEESEDFSVTYSCEMTISFVVKTMENH